MQYKNLLFDLDGTLTDPAEGITKSVQYALDKLGITENDLSSLERFIGPPIQDTFVNDYGFSKEDAWKGVWYYREKLGDTGIYQNKIFQGIPELLQMLRVQQRRLFVATSKPYPFARKIITHFELDPYFEVVYGSELDGTRSDKTSLIQYILEQEQLDASETIMIGDRKHDIIGAVNNSIHSIGIGYGFGSETELREARATYYYPTIHALTAAFS